MLEDRTSGKTDIAHRCCFLRVVEDSNTTQTRGFAALMKTFFGYDIQLEQQMKQPKPLLLHQLLANFLSVDAVESAMMLLSVAKCFLLFTLTMSLNLRTDFCK